MPTILYDRRRSAASGSLSKMYRLVLTAISSFCVLALCPTVAKADYPYKTMYFDQTIDHFNFKSHGNKTFKQRYLITDDYWGGGSSPIFIYTGNEADITIFLKNTGFLFDIAPQFSALVIFAEHRYYGESLPFGNESYIGENVGLLAIEQVLADYATLILAIKKQLKADDAPVIAFGGSYGGMLSAYLRFKYPNVVRGAISSGGPIYSAAGIGSQLYYFEDVTKVFNTVEASPTCVPTIRAGFSMIDELSKQGRAGLDKIGDAFRLCMPLETKNDVPHLLLWIRNSLSTLTTVNYPYPASFEGNLPAWPVNVSCALITNSNSTLQGLADGAILFYNGTHGSLKCIDIYGEFMECSDATGCGSKGWDYQVCTEVTRPAGTNGKTDMFPVLPFTEKMREEYCLKTWGVVPKRMWLNVQMFGKDIANASSNIFFSNGAIDPWRGGGVLENPNPSRYYTLLIPGAAHHLDLRGKNKDDPEPVKKARQEEIAAISQWIKQ